LQLKPPINEKLYSHRINNKLRVLSIPYVLTGLKNITDILQQPFAGQVEFGEF
jgi:hypothetical protein